MTIYKLEFKIDFRHHIHKEMRSKIENAINEVKRTLSIDVSQKFQLFGHNYSFEAEFKGDKSRKILDIFRKYATILHFCVKEEYVDDEDIEIEQHLKIK